MDRFRIKREAPSNVLDGEASAEQNERAIYRDGEFQLD
jgi:hypothetical protein